MDLESIVYTNDNCIGCNKCIKVCSAIGACVSREAGDKARIVVDGSKCVACGSCIDVCEHRAREFRDDTERFFEDLKRGEKISILLAPAFKANYPDRYNSVLGGLKAMGVNRIISVSFGADITTWGYLNYIAKHDFKGGISQPCPVVVSYIERYIPELIPKLFPVQSPLMCAAIYARKEMKVTDRFAFISPCIAKKMEMEDPHNNGLVQYNVTFEHLMDYVDEHNMVGDPTDSEIEYGLGSFYPTPGGLAENVKWFLGDDVFIRQIEGEKRLYEWMHQNMERIRDSRTPFLFIDALNCEKGCICGTAVNIEKSKTDDSLYELLKIREGSKKEMSGDAWSRHDTPEERLTNYNKQFEALDPDDYLREYTDRSQSCGYLTPDDEQLDEVFRSMNKLTKSQREINCTCCGYESCRQMAYAIYNGFNHKENCIFYEKTMVRELEAEKEIAEEANRAKSSFLANMSHEIRTPINAVLGMDEMIIREAKDGTIREYAEDIKRSGNMLLSLINNILDFSKIEAGKMDIVPEKYDFGVLMEDVIRMMSERAGSKDLSFKYTVDETIPRFLFGDPTRIKQCMVNILTNGIKYTNEGGVDLKVSVKSRTDTQILLDISVRDTGIGIKSEDIEKLFTAFERIDVSRNRNIEGTGLGMNIVQRLLHMMDSKLKVESEYGKGSEFSFELYQGIISPEEVGNIDISERSREKSAETDYRESFTAPDASVLIVDDSELNLKVAVGLLKNTRINIDTANGAREALELLNKKEYDVLLFDHMMPDIDGIELLARLKAMRGNPNSGKPCVVLTANAIAGAKETYLADGFDDYMSKPLNGELLERIILKYLPDDKVEMVREDVLNEEEEENLGIYSSIKEIDVRTGIANCGSLDDYKPILEIFYSSIDEKADELEKLYRSENWKDYTIKVHALKSSARIIGAADYADRAQEMESAGKAGNIGYIRDEHKKLIEDYRHYKDILGCVFETGNDEAGDDKPMADEYILKGAYEEIKKAADDLDIYAIDEAMGELEGYSLPETDRDIFAKLTAACRNFDYDGIEEILKNI